MSCGSFKKSSPETGHLQIIYVKNHLSLNNQYGWYATKLKQTKLYLGLLIDTASTFGLSANVALAPSLYLNLELSSDKGFVVCTTFFFVTFA